VVILYAPKRCFCESYPQKKVKKNRENKYRFGHLFMSCCLKSVQLIRVYTKCKQYKVNYLLVNVKEMYKKQVSFT